MGSAFMEKACLPASHVSWGLEEHIKQDVSTSRCIHQSLRSTSRYAFLGESVLEALISSLLVAAISGLTFLSYKHHDGYKAIARPLKVCACVVFISLAAYDLGFTAGKYGGTELSMMWTSLSFMGFWVLLAFLDILPMITDQGGK
jgi:hypothetical protein